MNKWLIFSLILCFSPNLMAETPTIIYAADKDNVSILEQPADAGNPLGNPISVPQSNKQVQNSDNFTTTQPQAANSSNGAPSNVLQENLPINPPISQQYSPQNEAKDIQATIYQGGDRIYDVQSVPIEDINKVEEPNIQPTVSTYPAY